MDFIEIGCTPSGEPCAQVGSDDYYERMKKETRAFKAQLERLFPLPAGVFGRLAVKGFPHDFGTYHEVVAMFNEDDKASCEWAYSIEANMPEYWDETAKIALEIPEALT